MTGGRPATTITGTSLVITADKQEDGGAIGMVQFDRAGFMRSRSGADYPPRDAALLDRARAEEGEHVEFSRYPLVDVVNAWDVSTMLELIVSGIEHRFITYDGSDDRTAIMTSPL
ncbi:hypothetical protein [Nonomuraea sp. NPDC002799]